MTTSIYNRTQNFLNKAKLIHNNKYDYSLVNYVNNYTKVKIICPVHGIFEQTPNNHLSNRGCKKCKSLGVDIFTNRGKLVHNNKYEYSLVKYKNAHTKVKIICPVHGIFEQEPRSHLNNIGCKKCSNENRVGFINNTILNRDPKLANKDATLYLIKHENLYKIGISINIYKRFNKSVQVISELDNITLLEAFTKEQEILEQYSQYREKPKNWNYGGDTEFINISNDQRDEIINNISAYGLAKGKVSC